MQDLDVHRLVGAWALESTPRPLMTTEVALDLERRILDALDAAGRRGMARAREEAAQIVEQTIWRVFLGGHGLSAAALAAAIRRAGGGAPFAAPSDD